jgi:hypothetical protein
MKLEYGAEAPDDRQKEKGLTILFDKGRKTRGRITI